MNAAGWHPQDCLRTGALEPLGRVEMGGEGRHRRAEAELEMTDAGLQAPHL